MTNELLNKKATKTNVFLLNLSFIFSTKNKKKLA